MNIKITGSGSYIPTETISNKDFSQHVFLNDDGTPFPHPNDIVAEKSSVKKSLLKRVFGKK